MEIMNFVYEHNSSFKENMLTHTAVKERELNSFLEIAFFPKNRMMNGVK